MEGFEPPTLSGRAPKARASASSATCPTTIKKTWAAMGSNHHLQLKRLQLYH